MIKTYREALRDAGVPDKCRRQQLWPVRPGYASTDETEFYVKVRANLTSE